MGLADRDYMRSAAAVLPFGGSRASCGGGLGRLLFLALVGAGVAAVCAGADGRGRAADWFRSQAAALAGRAGAAHPAVAALEAMDQVEVRGEEDLPDLRPHCTEKGHRVLSMLWRMSQFMPGPVELVTYELTNVRGDQADVIVRYSGGDELLVRMVREDGRWKFDDARGTGEDDVVWFSALLTFFGS